LNAEELLGLKSDFKESFLPLPPSFMLLPDLLLPYPFMFSPVLKWGGDGVWSTIPTPVDPFVGERELNRKLVSG
jgi:hypothetical protein